MDPQTKFPADMWSAGNEPVGMILHDIVRYSVVQYLEKVGYNNNLDLI